MIMKSQILSYLPPDFPWKAHIHVFDCVESTNDLAKSMASSGAPHGTVLIADCQTGGRGRRGRSFFSPAGMGIYMSVILRPQGSAQDLMHFTCAAAVSLCDAVEHAAGFRPGIKWTNDLVYESRKLAGILTEISLTPKTAALENAVIGIGINCCQRLEDFSPELQEFAGSLSMYSPAPVDRSLVAASILQSLEKMTRELLSDKEEMLTQYRRDCITIGKDISLCRGDEVRHGRAIDVDSQGALMVIFPDGHTETVNSGEVSVRGMYGYVSS